MPFPYARLIVGTRHCRVLISGSINSDATGIDLTPLASLEEGLAFLTTNRTQVCREASNSSVSAAKYRYPKSGTASVAPQTDIRLEKASIARMRDSRFEIKKLRDRTAIDRQQVISSVSQYSSFYSK